MQAIPKQAKVRLLEHLQKQQMPSAEFYYSQADPEGGSEAEENIGATSASAAAAKAATSEPTSALSNDRETTDSVAAGVIAATTDQGIMGSNVNAESAVTKCICNALIEANISAEASLQYAKEMVQDGCDTVAILTSLVDEEQLELWRFKPFHRRALLKWIQQKNV